MKAWPVLIAALIMLARADAIAGSGHGHDHGHDHHGVTDEPAKGPHGGRLLVSGDFSLEVTIFEKGVPPQFRVFPARDSKPLDPAQVKAEMRLKRFGGVVDDFTLLPEQDYLTSGKTVEEPHSFEVEVRATIDSMEHHWHYESFEGRTVLSDEALRAAAVTFDVAGSQAISDELLVYGRILPNEDKVAHITPRFSGVAKSVRKSLGDEVRKGEVLAVFESNQSLQDYEIRAQLDGMVVKRHVTAGEFVAETQEIFVLADLSEVWADFQLYRDDYSGITKGQKIVLELGDGSHAISATVSYVSPVTDEATQSRLIRAVIPNTDGQLRPGLFVQGLLKPSETSVSVAVHREALQTFRDWSVVYLSDGHVFQAMPVELGRRDSKYVEVLSGISAGAKYVVHNSFMIKADIEKSGASHDH